MRLRPSRGADPVSRTAMALFVAALGGFATESAAQGCPPLAGPGSGLPVWEQDAQVTVSFDPNIPEALREAMTKAISNWSRAGGSGVTFTFQENFGLAGDPFGPAFGTHLGVVMGPLNTGVAGETAPGASFFDKSGRAKITVNDLITDVAVVANVMSHEMGHTFGLGDCYSGCGSTAMKSPMTSSMDSTTGRPSPSACDHASVRQAGPYNGPLEVGQRPGNPGDEVTGCTTCIVLVCETRVVEGQIERGPCQEVAKPCCPNGFIGAESAAAPGTCEYLKWFDFAEASACDASCSVGCVARQFCGGVPCQPDSCWKCPDPGWAGKPGDHDVPGPVSPTCGDSGWFSAEDRDACDSTCGEGCVKKRLCGGLPCQPWPNYCWKCPNSGETSDAEPPPVEQPASWPSIEVPAPRLIVPSVVPAGTAFEIAVSGAQHPLDWVAVGPAGSSPDVFHTWQYLTGSQGEPTLARGVSRVVFNAPTAGQYVARLFASNQLHLLAESASIQVAQAEPSAPSLAIEPLGVAFGSVPTNVAASRAIIVRNDGGSAAQVSLALNAGPEVSLVSPSQFEVGPGNAYVVTLRYEALSAAQVLGELGVSAGAQSFAVPVTGETPIAGGAEFVSSFRPGAWGTCAGEGAWACSSATSTGCSRPGQQARTLEATDWTTIPEEAATEPPYLQPCVQYAPGFVAAYQTSVWGACAGSGAWTCTAATATGCTRGGVQQRAVTPSLWTASSAEQANAPATTQPCGEYAQGFIAGYSVGSWSECSSSCGSGYRTRTVSASSYSTVGPDLAAPEGLDSCTGTSCTCDDMGWYSADNLGQCSSECGGTCVKKSWCEHNVCEPWPNYCWKCQ